VGSRVSEGLRGVSEWLEGEFKQAAKEAKRSSLIDTLRKFLAQLSTG
jgi:hypothetical protein